MVTDQAVGVDAIGERNDRDVGWRRPLVVITSVATLVAFLGWITVLAVTLPTRYDANHWNVAWVGFDAMLLISLLTAAWSVGRRRTWAPTPLMVSAVLLTCDAWFDVTTASGGTATLVSVGFAVGVELPSAACLAWAATHRSLRRRARLILKTPQVRPVETANQDH
jgi:hypothetical protein